MPDKRPFAIDMAMARIREAIRPFPQAALFALAEEGFSSPFEVLVACIISIRTLDAVTLSCAHRLFALARAPLTMSQLTPEAIDEAIHACTFHEAKARQILEIENKSMMDHPFHLHGFFFQVLSKDGVPTPDDRIVRKDTVIVPMQSTLRLAATFDEPGRHPCPSRHQPLGLCVRAHP